MKLWREIHSALCLLIWSLCQHKGWAVRRTSTDSSRKSSMNVLYIIVDDLTTEGIESYGPTQAIAPNINKLAQGKDHIFELVKEFRQYTKTEILLFITSQPGSIQFRHAYVQEAVCGPSRNSFLTGKRPDSLQVYTFTNSFRDTVPDTVSLPQVGRSIRSTSVDWVGGIHSLSSNDSSKTTSVLYV